VCACAASYVCEHCIVRPKEIQRVRVLLVMSVGTVLSPSKYEHKG
jgi:hypothetical protein